MMITAPAAATGLGLTAVIVSVIAGLLGSISGVLAYRASTRANLINSRKVDVEDFNAQAERYRQIIAEQDRHLDRLRTQIDRLQLQMDAVNTQASREVDISNGLRDQVRALRGQVTVLEQLVEKRTGPAADPGAHR